jgi:hypothetical protein
MGPGPERAFVVSGVRSGGGVGGRKRVVTSEHCADTAVFATHLHSIPSAPLDSPLLYCGDTAALVLDSSITLVLVSRIVVTRSQPSLV